MRKLKAFLISTYKNVILKRKFKPFFLILFNQKFRENINYTYSLTKNKTDISNLIIPLSMLTYGHQILYPNYVKTIVIPEANEKGYIDMSDKIKAVRDGRESWRVVDGNHHLAALNQKFQYVSILIKEMT